jgi:hypothetical protein
LTVDTNVASGAKAKLLQIRQIHSMDTNYRMQKGLAILL